LPARFGSLDRIGHRIVIRKNEVRFKESIFFQIFGQNGGSGAEKGRNLAT